MHHSLQDAVSASVVYCTSAFLLGLLWFQSVTFGTCIGSSRKYPHPPWSIIGHSEWGVGGFLKDKSFVKSKSGAFTEIFRGVGGEELKPKPQTKQHNIVLKCLFARKIPLTAFITLIYSCRT